MIAQSQPKHFSSKSSQLFKYPVQVQLQYRQQLWKQSNIPIQLNEQYIQCRTENGLNLRIDYKNIISIAKNTNTKNKQNNNSSIERYSIIMFTTKTQQEESKQIEQQNQVKEREIVYGQQDDGQQFEEQEEEGEETVLIQQLNTCSKNNEKIEIDFVVNGNFTFTIHLYTSNLTNIDNNAVLKDFEHFYEKIVNKVNEMQIKSKEAKGVNNGNNNVQINQLINGMMQEDDDQIQLEEDDEDDDAQEFERSREKRKKQQRS